MSDHLVLELSPSRQWRVLQLAAHLSAGLGLLLIEMPIAWLLAGWLLVALHGLIVWHHTRWQRLIQKIRCDEGQYHLLLTDGQQQTVTGSGYFVMPWLIVLKLQVAKQRRFLPLFKDSCDADSLRRLRVWLRVKTRQ